MKKRFIFALVFIVILISIVVSALNSNKKIELIQLSPQGTNQMMGYIIKTKNDNIIVIDGGNSEDTDNFMTYIEKYNNKVDYWFITHPHNDHASVLLDAIDRNVNIENIYISLNDKDWYSKNDPTRAEFANMLIDKLNNNNIKNKVKEPQINETLRVDGIQIEILGIKNPEITDNAGNEQSMIIKFDTGKTSLLILGDAGEKSSKKLLEKQKDKLKSDIVQMSHHGQAGATKELYKEISPKICLWPTPEWLWNNDSGQGENSGQWKTFETRSWIEELGVKENYIAKDKDIKIEIK